MNSVKVGTLKHLSLGSAAIILAAILLAGCASGVARNFVPEASVGAAKIAGMPPNIRFWGDAEPKELRAIVEKKANATLARYKASGTPKSMNFLTLSGGGEDGAFGSGFLIGWRDVGTRPEFEIVTGISTGSLIAPMAFLGRKYDQQLKDAYTTIASEDAIFTKQILSGLLGGMALTDNTGLKVMIAKFATQQMLTDIAREHKRGRRLLIGTTNIDAQRGVIWDIGEIATSGHPDSLKLFNQILLASASVPGAFPPVFIKVNVNGKQYEEMHVDGGIINQVFLFPTLLKAKSINSKYGVLDIRRNLYVLRNTKINPEWKQTKASFFSISGRSMATLIKRQGIGDLTRMYARARRDGFNYNLAYIPPNFTLQAKSAFDPVYMKALYQVGYEAARAGYRWHKKPPDFESTARR